MKQILAPILLLLSMTLCFMSLAQDVSNGLPAEADVTEFNRLIHAMPSVLLLDVRTPEEFKNGHIEGAMNIDWYDSSFAEKAGTLDRSREVLVYCMSGRRSAAAAEKLHSIGFSTVVNLKGGILQWRAAGLPETGGGNSSSGMTMDEFSRSVSVEKLVLVDFYAEWCQPCKKMKPYLEEIAAEMNSTVTVIRIDADANRQLCKELAVDGLPVLQIYRQGKLLWNHTGFLEKSEVVAEIQRH